MTSKTVAQVDAFHSGVRDGIENIFFLSPLCSGGGRGGAGTCQQAVNAGSETRAGVNLTLRTTPSRDRDHRRELQLPASPDHQWYWEGFPERGRNAHVTLRYTF